MNDQLRERIGDAARSRFERAVDDLPAGTANRLRLARRAALAGDVRGRGRAGWGIPLGAAAALLLGIAWWRQAPAPGTARMDVGHAAAQAAASSNPSTGPEGPPVVEVPSEDEAELYAWMADTPVTSDAQGSAL